MQPELPLRDLGPLLAKIRNDHFNGTYGDVTWCFARQKTLAFIDTRDRRICLHNVMNGTDVPDEVFATILFHELLHLEIVPVAKPSGKPDCHPPEFWAAESARSPCFDAGWNWIRANIAIQPRPRLQCTDVLPRVRRFSPAQRAWAREQFGVNLPRVIRADDPSSRSYGDDLWKIAVLAMSVRG